MDVREVKQDLQQLRSKLASPDATPALPAPQRKGVHLLCSLDLTNSTEFKNASSEWPRVVKEFYRDAKKRIKASDLHNPHFKLQEGSDQPVQFRIWKYQGDEVLFFAVVRSIRQLVPAIRFLDKVVADCNDHMRKYGKGLEELGEQESGLALASPWARLGVKGAVWLCGTRDDAPSNLPDDEAGENSRDYVFRNLLIVHNEHRQKQIDFLGPDVDIGFRIAQYAPPRMIAMSAELLYVLGREGRHSESAEENARLNEAGKFAQVVGYEVLKGVWSGRLYPIIVWTEGKPSSELPYDYTEKYASYVKRMEAPEAEACGVVNKVIKDIGAESRLDGIAQFLIEGESAAEPEIPRLPLSEMHVVACCHHQNKGFLALRRSQKREHRKGGWEFGRGYADDLRSLAESVRETYSKILHLDVEVVNPLVPLAVFNIDYRLDSNAHGIVVLAEVAAEPSEELFDDTYYDDFRWIKNGEECREFVKKENAVADFLLCIERAELFLKKNGSSAMTEQGASTRSDAEEDDDDEDAE